MDKIKLEADPRLDQGELETDSHGDICITVLDVGKLGEATRCIAASQAGRRVGGWGFIAIITWAIAATMICVMQSRTIDQLQVIRTGSVERTIDGVHDLKEAVANDGQNHQ